MFFQRYKFFEIKNEISFKDTLNILDELVLDFHIKSNYYITEISSLNIFRENSILFLSKDKYSIPINYKNIGIITDNKNFFLSNKNHNILYVKDISVSYNIIINFLFHHEDNFLYELSDQSLFINGNYISKSSKIDKTVMIGKNCFIGKGVTIGENCIIKNNVVLKNCIIKNNVIINDNTTIGSTGFGFDLKKMGSDQLTPHIGIVLVEDNVVIGANCTIDRGKIDYTKISKNSMIDNLVHIAHNVIIGENACIAAQTGISGSVTIGDNLICGGQVGFAGHIEIGSNVVVAAKSGVTKNIADNSTIAGFPAVDIKEWKKQIINQKKNGYK